MLFRQLLEFAGGGSNRVILATDGDFNVGLSDPEALKIEEELERVAMSEAPGFGKVRIIRSDKPIDEVARQCDQADLTIIGVQRMGKRKKHFGRFAMVIVQKTTHAVMLISRRG